MNEALTYNADKFLKFLVMEKPSPFVAASNDLMGIEGVEASGDKVGIYGAGVHADWNYMLKNLKKFVNFDHKHMNESSVNMLKYEEFETTIHLFGEVTGCHVWREAATWKGMATRSGRSANAKPQDVRDKERDYMNRLNDQGKPFWYNLYQKQGTIDGDVEEEQVELLRSAGAKK